MYGASMLGLMVASQVVAVAMTAVVAAVVAVVVAAAVTVAAVTVTAGVIGAATGHALRPGLGNGCNIAVAEGGTTDESLHWLPGGLD